MGISGYQVTTNEGLVKKTLYNFNEGCINTTSDLEFETLIIPPNTLVHGSLITFNFVGTFTHGTAGSGQIRFWVKINGDKHTNIAATSFSSTTFSNRPYYFNGFLQYRTLTQFTNDPKFHFLTYHQLDTNAAVGSLSVPYANVTDTTIENTITVGCNLSVAGASNNVKVTQGVIVLW